MTTTELIRPVIWEIYGRSDMAEALVDELGRKIDNPLPSDPWPFGRPRREVIRLTCWNFFSGGGTAAIAADQIEELLNARD